MNGLLRGGKFILPASLDPQRDLVKFRPNMGSPRYIPRQGKSGLKVHRSVKMRMEAEYEDEVRRQKGKRYIPKPIFKAEPTWID